MKRGRKLFLFDPYSLMKRETNYKELMELTEQSMASLSSYKTRGRIIKRLNAYLVDEFATLSDLRKLANSVTIKDEVWARVPGFPNTVSTYGRVRSDRNNDFMIPYISRAGHLTIRLKRDKKTVTIPIHRLVALVFIEKDKECKGLYYLNCGSRDEDLLELMKQNTDCVVHRNGKLFDNRVVNLIWSNRGEIRKLTSHSGNSIPVLKICAKTGRILDFYESIAAAGAENFINPNAIGNCIKGKSKTSGGFLWRIDRGESVELNI